MPTDGVTQGLDDLHKFKLCPGGFHGPAGQKWLAVKTVREVFADTDTGVFFLVIEFTPKKGDPIGPLFDKGPSIRKAPGPVWHVIRWDWPAYKQTMTDSHTYAAQMDGSQLVDMAVQTAMNDGLGAVQGMKPIGIGPWPKRNMALMALCDVATRERSAWETTHGDESAS